MERHLATVWESVADATPHEVAVVQGGRRWSWAEFDQRSARLTGALQAAGLQPGAKVAEYLYNGPEYLETFYAAMKGRFIPVNVNYRYLDDELLYLLDNSEAEALVFHRSLADRVERIAARAPSIKLWVEVDDGEGTGWATATPYEDLLAAHDPASRITRDGDDIIMIYTGGTTGMPKGVMTRLRHLVDTYLVAVPAILGFPPLTEPDQVVDTVLRLAGEGRQYAAMPACPLMHGTGLGLGCTPTLTFGGRVVLLTGRGLDVDEVWSTVERESVNGLVIVGDAFARPLLRGLREGPPRELGSVGLVLSAGAMFSAEVKEGLLEFLPAATIVDYIAATEGGMGASISTKGAPAPTGRFVPNPGVKVFKPDGTEVVPGSGEQGMVGVPGGIPDGYYRDQAKTDSTFRLIDGVRYSMPGDWATVDADGMITLLGRGSQCINTGGEKVFPEEVEEALKRHELVEDALVFGLPDERFGQRVAAVVSLRPGTEAASSPPSQADVDAVVDSVRRQLSGYKVPRAVAVVDEVPRAPNGKADYPRAKELFEAAAAPT